MTKTLAGPTAALESERLMTPQEVADHLGVPLQTLYRWRTESKGPAAVKVGRHIRFTQASLGGWIASQTEVR